MHKITARIICAFCGHTGRDGACTDLVREGAVKQRPYKLEFQRLQWPPGFVLIR